MPSAAQMLDMSLQDVIDDGGRRRPKGSGGGRCGDRSLTVVVATRVYVGNLAWGTSWQDLKDHFSSIGTVVFADVMREDDKGKGKGGKGKGRSKGCGIVEFSRCDEAVQAIEELHDSFLGGRQIIVREDREDRDLKSVGGVRTATAVTTSANTSVPSARSAPAGGGTAPSGRRVYVGNLEFSVTWQEVKDHFRQVGDVIHAKLMERGDGSSKGCGIVEYSNAKDAARAIEQLHDTYLRGRAVIVREDREDFELTRSSKAGGKYGAYGPDQKRRSDDGVEVGTRIYVQNLAYTTSWQDLKDHFREVGHVVHSDVMKDLDGRSKGCGIVEFETSREARRAIREMMDTMLGGRPILVREDREDRAVYDGGKRQRR